jgi:hypothetical protein
MAAGEPHGTETMTGRPKLPLMVSPLDALLRECVAEHRRREAEPRTAVLWHAITDEYRERLFAQLARYHEAEALTATVQACARLMGVDDETMTREFRRFEPE